MGDLAAIVLTDRSAFDPARCRLHHLVRIVDREKDAIRTDREDCANQRLVVEISAGRHIKVLAQIILQPLPDSLVRRVVFETALDSPGKVWKRLAKMAENYGEVWKAIKESAVDQTQRMCGGLCCKSPSRAHKFRVAFIAALVEWWTRMKIYGCLQRCCSLPEWK